MIKKTLIFYILILLTIAGCTSAPVPDVESIHKEQKITSIQTKEFNKIEQFSKTLKELDIAPIYIYIDKDGSKNMSGSGGELPPRMVRLITSLLVDFGPKVKVIDNKTVAARMLNSPKYAPNVYILDGAITMYDKNIMTQSSGFNFGFDFGGGDTTEGNSNTDTKDKDSLSVLGVDFYLRQNGIISYKTSGKIDMRSTTRGYSFGISINNGGIGMSGYKTIRDGAGISVRKLLQESMYNLIKQIVKNRDNF